jgi:uncharacterized protein (DUF2236 family)
MPDAVPGQLQPPAAEWPSLVPGPDAIVWQRAGDIRVLAAAGYALILQVAHPTVGAGVSEHSNFAQDPWGRLLRTLDYACTMVYAGADAAAEAGRRLRGRHARIRGTLPDGRPYSALEPGAYAWVHATLAEGIVAAHERFGRRFSGGEREELWAQWVALGRLLGIEPGQLPPDWDGFRAYFGQMTGSVLERTPAVDEVLAALARPAPPVARPLERALWPLARMPLSHLVRLTTAGLLPGPLRSRLGVGWSGREEGELRVLGATMRAATPLMPDWLLNVGPGYLRWRERQAGP